MVEYLPSVLEALAPSQHCTNQAPRRPVISGPRKWTQKDLEFKAIFGYVVISRLAWAT